jgi:Fe-S cluster biogenesis protein NfuA
MAKQDIIEKIAKALNKIRPMLEQDGGDVEFVDFDEASGVVKVRLQGHCAVCPMAQITLKKGIESAILQDIPEIKTVKAI